MADGWGRDGDSNLREGTLSTSSGSSTGTSGVQNTTGTQRTTGTQKRTGSSVTSQSVRNISPTGNAALDSLISTLMDKPNIKPAQLDATAPLPKQRAVRGGGSRGRSSFAPSTGPSPGDTISYEWYDPLTGNSLTTEQATKMMSERQEQRDAMTTEAGVTQGGTVTQRKNQIARDQTISNLIQGQADYNKQAAFKDAQGLIDQYLREFGETNVSELTRAAEGAGTSASSVRSLLMNDLTARAAEGAGALGVKTAVEYGDIASKFAGILEGLTENDPVLDSLLNVLNIAKGAVQDSVGVTNTSETVKTDQTTTTNQQTKTEQAQNQIQDIIRKSTGATGLDFASYGGDSNRASSIERGVVY